MPNWKLPIQRANNTCEPNANNRAGDPDHEHCAGEPLHKEVLSIQQARLDLRPGKGKGRQQPALQAGCVFGASQCHARFRSLRPFSRPPIVSPQP